PSINYIHDIVNDISDHKFETSTLVGIPKEFVKYHYKNYSVVTVTFCLKFDKIQWNFESDSFEKFFNVAYSLSQNINTDIPINKWKYGLLDHFDFYPDANIKNYEILSNMYGSFDMTANLGLMC